MANTFAPFGFSQTGTAPGNAPNAEQATYSILYSDTAKIYTGDPVKLGSGGYIAAWTAGTAVSQMFGIFVGCKYLSTSQGRIVWSPYWPGADVASGAQSSIEAYVIPCSPGSAPRFVVQTGNSNTTASAVTIADVGQNADVAMGTGSTLTGRSGAYLDMYTAGTTSTLPFRIIGLYQGVGNGSDATSANNWVIVEANTLQTTGI
jgi:hypothetical protein